MICDMLSDRGVCSSVYLAGVKGSQARGLALDGKCLQTLWHLVSGSASAERSGPRDEGPRWILLLLGVSDSSLLPLHSANLTTELQQYHRLPVYPYGIPVWNTRVVYYLAVKSNGTSVRTDLWQQVSRPPTCKHQCITGDYSRCPVESACTSRRHLWRASVNASKHICSVVYTATLQPWLVRARERHRRADPTPPENEIQATFHLCMELVTKYLVYF